MKRLIVLAVASTLMVGCGFEIVDTGHRGVKTYFGEVVNKEPLKEGFYTYNPLTSDVVEIDTRTQKFEGQTVAYTQDVQQVTIDLAINYNLNPDAVIEVYKSVGTDWDRKLMPQLIEGNIQNVIGQYKAEELVEQRQEAVLKIKDLMKKAALERNVSITEVELPKFKFTHDFEQAVESKVIATQRAQEARNNTRKFEEEAKQKVINAEAEARSMEIRAEALTQNKSLVEYEAVMKWDGKLPVQMVGGALPFLDITNPHR